MFAPLRGFMGATDVAVVAEYGTLADGTPWPLTVTLEVPSDAVPADAAHVVLSDQEGSPLAVLAVAERRPVPGPGDAADRSALPTHVRLAGPVTPLREPGRWAVPPAAPAPGGGPRRAARGPCAGLRHPPPAQ